MKKILCIALISFFMVCILVSQSKALKEPAFPAEVKQYLALLNTIKNSKEKQSLVPLFYTATQTSIVNEQLNTKLYDSEIEYKEFLSGLKKNYEGLSFYEEDGAIFARVDSAYFLKLAKQHGTEEDIKFFEVYNKFHNAEYPEDDHPYMSSEEHFKICVDFSSPQIYEFYHDWINYIGEYPTYSLRDFYRSYASNLLSDYETYIGFATCTTNKTEKEIDANIEKLINELTADSKDNSFSLKLIEKLKIRLRK